jgi:hypothetical protein
MPDLPAHPSTEVLLDAWAQDLLADAVASLDAEFGAPPPGTGGDTHQPDMGSQMTQPTPAPPAAQPNPNPAPAPAPQPPNPPPQPAPAPAASTPPAAPVIPSPGPPPPHPQPNPPSPGPPPPHPQPSVGDAGFPPNTPWREMEPAQQTAYWQHQARKHEERVRAMSDYDQLRQTADEYTRLVEASRTDQERAVAEARRQGRAEALTEAGGRLVEAYVRAAATGRLEDERVTTLLQHLDRNAFVNSSGEVDTGKVYDFVHSIAPPPAPQQPDTGAPGTATPPAGATPAVRQVPDYGQGRPATAPPTGLEAGRAAARARFGPRQPQPQA